MDAFYASVEQRDFAEYRGKPIAVGGLPAGRGVVATCSYEARKYGVHSAMPSSKAQRLCPNLIFIKPRFDVYSSLSRRIQKIFKEYTDLVEPLSLDEAYLDVTENKKNNPSASLIARELKEKIKQKTGLTASAGISYCKFLAKIASDMNKPDGLFLIEPKEAMSFIETLEIGKFFGVGAATEEKMKQLGIKNGADLKKLTKYELVDSFGKQGLHFYNIARGIDKREVKPNRVRKSVGKEKTFKEDVTDLKWIIYYIKKIAKKVSDSLKARNLNGKTVTLKVRYADFETITRSVTLNSFINSSSRIKKTAIQLLKDTQVEERPVRLLGITVSGFKMEEDSKNRQLEFKFSGKKSV